ncbi:MAG: type II toxin-antitoxin system HicB family antitoxin [Desulfarculus sp.]|nr:type II toxin-antitoxin system HicB family antitoxin [Desulfarculus sp.]
MAIQVQMTLRVPVEIKKRGKWFVATCPVLDVVTQGETAEKAKKNLEQALTLFLVSCFERGTLEEVLSQCGFRPSLIATPSVPKKPVGREEYLNVPIPFLVNHAAGSAGCHA